MQVSRDGDSFQSAPGSVAPLLGTPPASCSWLVSRATLTRRLGRKRSVLHSQPYYSFDRLVHVASSLQTKRCLHKRFLRKVSLMVSHDQVRGRILCSRRRGDNTFLAFCMSNTPNSHDMFQATFRQRPGERCQFPRINYIVKTVT